MKIGIYDPYLDSLGGGERYVLTLAEFLSRKGQVEVFWDDQKIKGLIKRRFNLKMDKVNFVKDPFGQKKSFFLKFRLTHKYDLIFFLSDGSIPVIFSKRGILHFQVPFTHIAKTLNNKIKLARFQNIVCNSQFTKKFIDETYGVKSKVIYPPVDLDSFEPQSKKNVILSVGRFTRTLHQKKQEILIDSFKNIFSRMKEWELILAGGLMPEDKGYVEKLKRQADGLPVKILVNITFKELKTLYGQAKIYWHGAGFGEVEEEHPERMEHFGLSTVEAMSAGCVPIVYAGGGQKEIITHGENGFLWRKLEELEDQTLTLAKDEKKYKKVSHLAQDRSKDFSKEKFCNAYVDLIFF